MFYTCIYWIFPNGTAKTVESGAEIESNPSLFLYLPSNLTKIFSVKKKR